MTTKTPLAFAARQSLSVAGLGIVTAWSRSSPYIAAWMSCRTPGGTAQTQSGYPGTSTSGNTTSLAPLRAASAIVSQAWSMVASRSMKTGAICAAATVKPGSDCFGLSVLRFRGGRAGPGQRILEDLHPLPVGDRRFVLRPRRVHRSLYERHLVDVTRAVRKDALRLNPDDQLSPGEPRHQRIVIADGGGPLQTHPVRVLEVDEQHPDPGVDEQVAHALE